MKPRLRDSEAPDAASHLSQHIPNMQSRPHIVGCATALPDHRYTQDQLVTVARQLLPELAVDARVLQRFFRSTGVTQRCLALAAEQYTGLDGFEQRSRAWLSVALELGEQVVRRVLAEAQLDAREVGMFMSTSVTG